MNVESVGQPTLKQTPTISKLAEALAKAQAVIQAPVKNQTVTMKFQDKQGNWKEKSYKYADLGGVIDSIRKPLADNGLAYFHKMGNCEGSYGMRTILVHTSGEMIDTWYPLPDPQKQNVRAQDFGGALTYARRYSLSALVGISSDEDDDVQNDPADQKESKKQPPKNNPPMQKQSDKAADKPKGGSTTDPGHYVMPFGSNVKGKALKNLNEATLKEIHAFAKAELVKDPNNAQILDVEKNVREFLGSMDVQV